MPYCTEIKEWDTFSRIFNELAFAYNNYDICVIERQQTINLALSKIVRCIADNMKVSKIHITSQATSTCSKINYIIEHIESNLSEKFNINHLAEMANYNPNYFIMVFKTYIGKTPIQYINDCKLNEGKRLLLFTDKPVKEIAENLGFQSEQYFSRIFTKHYGTNPSKVRDNYRNVKNNG